MRRELRALFLAGIFTLAASSASALQVTIQYAITANDNWNQSNFFRGADIIGGTAKVRWTLTGTTLYADFSIGQPATLLSLKLVSQSGATTQFPTFRADILSTLPGYYAMWGHVGIRVEYHTDPPRFDRNFYHYTVEPPTWWPDPTYDFLYRRGATYVATHQTIFPASFRVRGNEVSRVPEPTPSGMLAIGLVILAASRSSWRRRRAGRA